MHCRVSRPWRQRRGRRAARRLGPPALAATCTLACLAPVAARADTIVAVAGSSVIVSGQPVGDATITAWRRDSLTGKPVVLGRFTGQANGLGPFSVNTTPPDVGGGDCWQKGALASPLTPDLLPGDAVTVTGAPGVAGGVQPPALTVLVPPDAKPSDGPIPGCASVAPFARNAITDAPQQVTGGPITVSGRAQPLATGVSVIAADAAHATATASATPAEDGTWSATIPAADLAALADGPLTVTPVFAVPDVATGAQAHLAAAPVSVQKHATSGDSAASAPGAPAPGVSTPAQAGGEPASPVRPGAVSPAGTATLQVMGLRVPARLSVAAARGRGISASLIAPAGASTVQLQLRRGGRTLATKTVAARPGTRKTVRLSSPAVRRLVRRGRYELRARAGSSPRRLGPPLIRTVVVR
jgi:hypothetical protein